MLFLFCFTAELITFLQFLLKLLNLLLKLAQQSILRILIDPGFVLDVFSPIGVAKGTDGLIIVIVCRAYICTLVRRSKKF